MSEVTYDQLKNNIVTERDENGTMHVTFKCPVSEKTFEQSAGMRRDNSVASNVRNEVKREAAWGARRAIVDFVYRLLGRNRAGQIGSRVAYSATGSGGVQYSYGKSEKQQAVCDAFQSISKNFQWDDSRQAFVYHEQ
jgi:hypothetical protein